VSFIYLACPYSHPSHEVRQQRFEAVNRCAADLMRLGHVVYSPISHNHPIALAHDFPKGWEFWGRMDEVFIRLAHKVYILQLPGWQESEGVRAEIALAQRFYKPIVHIPGGCYHEEER